jgi:ABC-type uncharacterized transport system permease subunit
MLEFYVNWIAASLAMATPYALAALGLILAERAGVLSLTAEGLMLVGALAGIASFLVLGGYPAMSLAVAAVAAALVSLLFATLVIVLRVNQVIAGLVIVFFCQGLTSMVGTMAGWENRPIAGLGKVYLGPLADIPILGPVLFSQDLVVYATIPIFVLVNHLLTRTRFGLHLRAVGENPEAADAAGISVPLFRFVAVLSGSLLVGLAGAYLSVVSTKLWIQNMTGGRGWIAIALVIFARWRPWRALLGALLFGSVEALIPRVAAAGIPVPRYFMLMTPYLVTLGVMIWITMRKVGTRDDPGALGQPYVREERR